MPKCDATDNVASLCYAHLFEFVEYVYANFYFSVQSRLFFFALQQILRLSFIVSVGVMCACSHELY